MVKALISSCLLTALVCGASTTAAAATFDKRTYFTFNQPVTLPGVTLPAGSYTFRLMSPFSNSVVNVSDRAGMHSYAMLFTIPVIRSQASSKPEIEFMETGAGVPNAVRGWWYPDETSGYQFIYSKDQLRRLTAGVAPAPAAVAKSAVRAAASPAPADESAARAEAAPSAPAPEAKAEARAEEPAAEAEQGAPGAAGQGQAGAASSAPQPSSSVQQEARTELPHTASPIWLLLALGTLSASSGLVLVRGARRS